VQAASFTVTETSFDLEPVWNALPCGTYDLLIQGFDANGEENCKSWHKRFWKVPGWDGVA
jgi:hypothetical protein